MTSCYPLADRAACVPTCSGRGVLTRRRRPPPSWGGSSPAPWPPTTSAPQAVCSTPSTAQPGAGDPATQHGSCGAGGARRCAWVASFPGAVGGIIKGGGPFQPSVCIVERRFGCLCLRGAKGTPRLGPPSEPFTTVSRADSGPRNSPGPASKPRPSTVAGSPARPVDSRSTPQLYAGIPPAPEAATPAFQPAAVHEGRAGCDFGLPGAGLLRGEEAGFPPADQPSMGCVEDLVLARIGTIKCKRVPNHRRKLRLGVRPASRSPRSR
jgi:hypothetical protein